MLICPLVQQIHIICLKYLCIPYHSIKNSSKTQSPKSPSLPGTAWLNLSRAEGKEPRRKDKAWKSTQGSHLIYWAPDSASVSKDLTVSYNAQGMSLSRRLRHVTTSLYVVTQPQGQALQITQTKDSKPPIFPLHPIHPSLNYSLCFLRTHKAPTVGILILLARLWSPVCLIS